MNRMNINNILASTGSLNKQSSKTMKSDKSFQEILGSISQNKEVKFSKHALERLKTRNISLTETEVSKIGEAMKKAEQKGVNEALILMDSKIFIASIRNKTIITAACEEQLKDNVFTKIDGAVVI